MTDRTLRLRQRLAAIGRALSGWCPPPATLRRGSPAAGSELRTAEEGEQNSPAPGPEAPSAVPRTRPSLPRRLAASLPGLRWPAVNLPGGLRPWITCLSLGFLLAALLGHGRQVLQLSFDAQGWLWLALGLGLQGASLLVNGLAWAVILRWRGQRPRVAALVMLYAGSNLRKYLPGGIWHLAARVQALRQEGAPVQGAPLGTAQALVVTLLDPLLAAVAALALLPLGGWQNGLAAV
ncbi:MAG: hypothetical protein ACKO0M_05140, partial [Cyanobium sp.]